MLRERYKQSAQTSLMDAVLVTTRMSADIRRHANSVDDDVIDEDDIDIDVTGKAIKQKNDV